MGNGVGVAQARERYFDSSSDDICSYLWHYAKGREEDPQRMWCTATKDAGLLQCTECTEYGERPGGSAKTIALQDIDSVHSVADLPGAEKHLGLSDADVYMLCMTTHSGDQILLQANTQQLYQYWLTQLPQLCVKYRSEAHVPQTVSIRQSAVLLEALMAVAALDDVGSLSRILNQVQIQAGNAIGRDEIIEIVDESDAMGNTPLMVAAQTGAYDCLSTLLELDISTTDATADAISPTFQRGSTGTRASTTGVHVNSSAVNRRGETAMCLAAAHGHLGCLELLCAHHDRIQSQVGSCSSC